MSDGSKDGGRQPPSSGRCRRFRVEPERLQGDTVSIEGSELRHLRVLRLSPGERVRLFDGAGREVEAELVTVERHRAEARVVGEIDGDREAPVDVWLLQGLPAKLQRMDVVVRQCTELGVAGVLPVIAARSQMPGGGRETVERRLRRWRRIAAEAAKQCGRSRVPEVGSPAAWEEIDWTGIPGLRLVLHPTSPRGELRRILVRYREQALRDGLAMLVGPEGGWEAAELERAEDAGALAVGLGKRILRTDTAGMAALSVVLYEARSRTAD